jgi:hypothetical protein
MANYVYRPDDLERSHEAYARGYKVVASRQIERLARQSRQSVSKSNQSQ